MTSVTILNPLTNKEIDQMVEYARSILELYAPELLTSSDYDYYTLGT